MSAIIDLARLETRLNRQAKTQAALKRGLFEVSRNDGQIVVQWSQDQRTERFLVKEPLTPGEETGTITDVFFRLKRRLTQPATDTASVE